MDRWIILLFLGGVSLKRTAKDFKMMRGMKKKLNPHNSVSTLSHNIYFLKLHNIRVNLMVWKYSNLNLSYLHLLVLFQWQCCKNPLCWKMTLVKVNITYAAIDTCVLIVFSTHVTFCSVLYICFHHICYWWGSCVTQPLLWSYRSSCRGITHFSVVLCVLKGELSVSTYLSTCFPNQGLSGGICNVLTY